MATYRIDFPLVIYVTHYINADSDREAWDKAYGLTESYEFWDERLSEEFGRAEMCGENLHNEYVEQVDDQEVTLTDEVISKYINKEG